MESHPELSAGRRGGRPVWAAGVVAVALLSAGLFGAWGVLQRPSSAQAAARSLPDYGEVPAFRLVDQEGRALDHEQLRGTVWIAGFLFTRCAGQCPLMAMETVRLQQATRRLAGVRFVSFSVDPAYDTPPRLAAYAAHYGSPADDRWLLVTEAREPDHGAASVLLPEAQGPMTSIARLAQQGFHLGVADGGSETEPVTHSTKLVLVDRAAHIRGYYDVDDRAAMARLLADATALSRGSAARRAGAGAGLHA